MPLKNRYYKLHLYNTTSFSQPCKDPFTGYDAVIAYPFNFTRNSFDSYIKMHLQKFPSKDTCFTVFAFFIFLFSNAKIFLP